MCCTVFWHCPSNRQAVSRAAVLFRSLIEDHPFGDGNKRVAVAATLVFLYLNDEVVCATDRELVTLALRVAMNRPHTDVPDLATWFGRRSLSMAAIEAALQGATVHELVARLPGRASLKKRPFLDLVIDALSLKD